MNSVEQAVANVYKSESAKLLAVLTRLFGTHNLGLAEDVLQEAFSKALIHWQKEGIPDNPAAWITQTSKNRAIDAIRANKTKIKLSADLAHYLESEWSLGCTVDQEFLDHKIKDDQLRMIFMCCHEGIKPENRIPFILKNLCGFSISAISRAFVIPEATVKKRLLRTKQQLRDHAFEFPPADKIAYAMDSVHTILYLLFNEGFHSSDKNTSLNLTFCQEAIGLVHLLIDEPDIANQDTLALFALMHFHIARAASKIDNNNHAIPIDLQDRTKWNKAYINTANYFLELANTAKPGASGRFFIEALIAKEHCHATNFEQTNWALIAEHYEQLVSITQSPVAKLNQAIATGYAGHLDTAIHQVESLLTHKAFKSSHMPLATLAHLHAKAGHKEQAYSFADQSKDKGGTQREHDLMMQQIERLLS